MRVGAADRTVLRVSDRADEGPRAAAERFPQGDLSVPDLCGSRATEGVVQQRSLRGLELKLDALLEEWQQAGWDDRVAVVDRLRSLCRRVLDER